MDEKQKKSKRLNFIEAEVAKDVEEGRNGRILRRGSRLSLTDTCISAMPRLSAWTPWHRQEIQWNLQPPFR